MWCRVFAAKNRRYRSAKKQHWTCEKRVPFRYTLGHGFQEDVSLVCRSEISVTRPWLQLPPIASIIVEWMSFFIQLGWWIGDNGCIICLCELRVSQRFSATCLWTASCSSGVNRTTFNAILMIQKSIPRIFGTYFASNFPSSLQSQIVSRSKSDEVLKSYRLCLLARRCSATRSTSLGSCQHRWHWVLLAATTTCCALKEHNMLHIQVHIEYFMRSNVPTRSCPLSLNGKNTCSQIQSSSLLTRCFHPMYPCNRIMPTLYIEELWPKA